MRRKEIAIGLLAVFFMLLSLGYSVGFSVTGNWPYLVLALLWLVASLWTRKRYRMDTFANSRF